MLRPQKHEGWLSWPLHLKFHLTLCLSRALRKPATALEIGSVRTDAERIRRVNSITLKEIPLAPSRFLRTEAVNQIPTSLLFRDGTMIDRRLGAQSAGDLTAWIESALSPRGVQAR